MRTRWRWAIAAGVVGLCALLATFAPWRRPAAADPLALGGTRTGMVFADQYANIADAISAVPNGGTLFVPAGEYTAPDTNGWAVNKPMTILGEGQANPNNASWDDIGTIFRPYSTTNGTVFVVTGDEVIFKNFSIGNSSAPASTGAGDGIRIGLSTGTPQGFRMENVTISFMGRHGINIMGDADWHDPVGSESAGSQYGLDRGVFQGCMFWNNRGCGIRAHRVTSLSLSSCWFIGNRLEGIRVKVAAAISLRGCGTQENGVDMSNVVWRGQMDYSTVYGLSVLGHNTENFNDNTNKNGIVLENCQGWSLTGLHFTNNDCADNTTAIIIGGGSRGGFLAGWDVFNVSTSVLLQAGDSNTGNIIAPPYVGDNTVTCDAAFSVPAASSPGANPASSGGNFVLWPLTVQAGGSAGMSFIGGVQLPIIGDTTSFTQTPPLGMVVFDSTSSAGTKRQLRYWDGANWRYIQGN